MNCPDRNVLSMLADGEELDNIEELLSHIRGCAECRKILVEEDRGGELIRRYFKENRTAMLKESIPCPPAEELSAFSEGKIALYRKRQLLRHFCACPVCARAVLDVDAALATKSQPVPLEVVKEARGVYKKGRQIKGEKK